MHDDTPKTHRYVSAAEQPQRARLVNLTPHQVSLEALNNDNEFKCLILPSAGEILRLVIASEQRAPALVRIESRDIKEIAIPVVEGTRVGRIESSLPAPQPEVLCVANCALAEHLPERSDLV